MDDNLETVELARKDGEDSVVILLRLCKDGAIRVDGQDMGPLVERTWAHDDYEYSVMVPAKAVPRLAFELLRDRLSGNLSAEIELRKFCRERSIVSEFWSWP
jgi:hypothetical protein